MPDREIFVARYGKIYKRKAPSPVNSIKLNSPPGCQYCKLCDSHKPNAAFYTATKRYVCRRCHATRVKNRVQERIAPDSAVSGSVKAWTILGSDRFWFGYPKLQFDSTTIMDIVVHANIPWTIYPLACPIDPSIPMRPRNVAILSRKSYALLIAMWKQTLSRALYIAFVQRCNLVPPRFDVAFPCDPYANPDYVRPILDVGSILETEHGQVDMSIQTADHAFLMHSRGEDLDTTPPSDEYKRAYSRA